MSDDPRKTGGDGPIDQRPYLCIPYWSVPLSPTEPPDNGVERPLPAAVISWECQGIHPGPYTPGSPLDVTVEIHNAGAGNQTSLATVVVYWADPTVGFTKAMPLGACLVPVPPRGGVATSPLISGMIPSFAPNHICLLAVVTHALDQAGKVIDPLNDRHWAQHNVMAVGASAGQPIRFPFMAANHFGEEVSFELLAHPLGENKLAALGLRLKASPVDAVRSLHIEDSTGRRIIEPSGSPIVGIKLKAGGTQALFLVFGLDGDLKPHEFAAVEVLLNQRAERAVKQIGSLGLVIQAPSHECHHDN